MKDTNGRKLSPQEEAERDRRKLEEDAQPIIEYCKKHHATVFINADDYTIGNENANMVPSIKK